MLQRDEAAKVLASRVLFEVLDDNQRRLSLGLEPEEFAVLPLSPIAWCFRIGRDAKVDGWLHASVSRHVA